MIYSNKFKIRRANAFDLRAVLSCLEAFEPDNKPLGLSQEKVTQVFQEQLRSGHILLVAETHEPEIVGTAKLYLERKFYRHGGIVAHIEDVAVERLWRGKGVGKELVQFCIQAARETGAYKVVLNCRHALTGWYESLDFHESNVEMRVDLL